MTANLTILSTSIRQDAAGRFCLNDFHKASGGEKAKQPANFLRLGTTKDLLAEISHSSDMRSDPLAVINGGTTQGSYACKELVYAYAMWISSAFHLRVIRAFDDLVHGRLPAPPTPLAVTDETPEALAARALVALQDKATRQTRELALAKDKATVMDWFIHAGWSLGMNEVAASLNMPRRQVTNYLQFAGLIRPLESGGGYAVTQSGAEKGYLTGTLTVVQRTGRKDKVTGQIRITAAGMLWMLQSAQGGSGPGTQRLADSRSPRPAA